MNILLEYLRAVVPSQEAAEMEEYKKYHQIMQYLLCFGSCGETDSPAEAFKHLEEAHNSEAEIRNFVVELFNYQEGLMTATLADGRIFSLCDTTFEDNTAQLVFEVLEGDQAEYYALDGWYSESEGSDFSCSTLQKVRHTPRVTYDWEAVD